MRLEHVNLTVSDIDRSVAFYSELLDFRVRWEGGLPSGARAVHVGNDDMYLALFESRSEGDFRETYNTPGYNHMGFVVDDVDASVERLTNLGAKFGEVYEDEGRRSVYLYDPDGHEIELVQY